MAAQEKWHWQDSGKAWKGVGIYHVTMTVPSRQPLLGTLVIPGNDPTKAFVERTQLGKALLNSHRNITKYHPEIQILQYSLMPDHLHCVWYVRKPMEHGIRYAVQGFWRAAKKIGRAYTYLRLSAGAINENKTTSGTTNESKFSLSAIALPEKQENPLRQILGGEKYALLDPIFTEMPFIRPMSKRGQLQTMIHYVQLNPQRLATKRLMPGFFRVQKGIEIAGRTYSGVGNAALLQAESFAPVHVRHTMVEAAEHGEPKALRDYMNGCVSAARKGTVMVSPFISPQEKQVMEVLLQEEHPFIYLADNGFRDYYKPQDSLFEACAAGRVMMLSPWEYDANKQHISRADCIALNGMAEEIANMGN